MKRESLLILALALNAALFAQEPLLKKIVISGDQEELETVILAAEERFLGETLTQEVVAEIKNYISNCCKEAGLPLVSVSTPPQEITDGSLTFDVSMPKLGEIAICGNKWVPDKQICGYIRLESGSPINIDQFTEDLAWINRNPFRRTDAIFVPAKDSSTTDIQLYVWDRFPVRAYGGFDNRGNDAIGTERMFAGFNLGNLFNFDHRVSYQYTCSLTFGSLNAHTGRYDMPLPWRHEISIFGGYSTVNLKNLGSQFRNHGYSYQASGRYIIPLKQRTVLDLFLGFDYKMTNNNLEFAEVPVFSSNVALGQFVFGFTYQSQPGCNVLYFNLDVATQLHPYFKDMSNADYQTLRPRAHNAYIYGRGTFEYTHRFVNPKLSFFTRLMGQAASTNLLPSEEFGLGGADTVRGYKERIVNGDNAVLANLELRWDAFSFLRRKIKCPTCCESNEQIYERRKLGDLFSLLAFFDYGFTHVQLKSPFEPTCAYLMSAGPGIRYDFDQYIHAKLDWGIQLHKIIEESYGTRLHFAVIGSY